MIRKVTIEEIQHLAPLARKERVPLTETKSEVNYLGFIDVKDDAIVGFVGYTVGKICRLKSDFVHPIYRGQGIYRSLFEARLIRLDKYKAMDAYCTPMSLPTYLKYGFKSMKTDKHGITYVTLFK